MILSVNYKSIITSLVLNRSLRSPKHFGFRSLRLCTSMSWMAKACDECALNCLLIHKKKHDPSPLVTSFFKVMIGDRFTEALFVPPRFAQKLTSLVDKETYLEDSVGRRWAVSLSRHEGYLVIQQGWKAFLLDHGIELGDFLVFHHVIGSHFFVQIYGKNGCEKHNFDIENKRSKTARDLIAKDGQCNLLHRESISKQRSNSSSVSGLDAYVIQNNVEDASNRENNNVTSQPVSTVGYIDESCLLLNRDVGFMRQDYRSSFFDLSDFEMSDAKHLTAETNKFESQCNGRPHDTSPLLKGQTETALIEGDTMIMEGASVSKGAFDVEITGGKGEVLCISEKDHGKSSGISPVVETIINTYAATDRGQHIIEKASSKKGTLGQLLTVSHQEHMEKNVDKAIYFTGIAQLNEGTSPAHSSERCKVAKQEQIELEQELSGDPPDIAEGDPIQILTPVTNEVHKLVEGEPVELVDFPSPLAAEISCLVTTGSKSFLELSTSLPTFVGRGRPRTKLEKVVVLRDPDMRLWPVLYHEKLCFKVLTSGWPEFSKANNVRPGDQCCFAIENEAEGIYRVRIIRK
ncbi:hypothetical protein Nepgr_033309 [Nepenthes gracilis]|uniref:TF-B3 domain-containing protein n=1 Tax=Nepenthes gracilis TaxID=150966 RepID=A0AAD3TLR1_NEPGR|nr:hypothetical protein Nepgr_033309 [Nepenthes gracilis]